MGKSFCEGFAYPASTRVPVPTIAYFSTGLVGVRSKSDAEDQIRLFYNQFNGTSGLGLSEELLDGIAHVLMFVRSDELGRLVFTLLFCRSRNGVDSKDGTAATVIAFNQEAHELEWLALDSETMAIIGTEELHYRNNWPNNFTKQRPVMPKVQYGGEIVRPWPMT